MNKKRVKWSSSVKNDLPIVRCLLDVVQHLILNLQY